MFYNNLFHVARGVKFEIKNFQFGMNKVLKSKTSNLKIDSPGIQNIAGVERKSIRLVKSL